MKRFSMLMLGLLMLPISVMACGFGEKVPEGYENTAVNHAYQHWNQGDASAVPFIFIDVRTPGEFVESRIDGAILIPVEELQARMAEIPRDKQVYLICRSGNRSADAALLLAQAGYRNIENVVGGMIAWEAAGYPVVKP